MSYDIYIYTTLLQHIKTRVRTAQIKATLSVNAEMIGMYYDIGQMNLYINYFKIDLFRPLQNGF
mgnify:CR=1 FL=1